MNRLLSTLRADIVLQFRNGFYFVSGFVAVMFIVMLNQVGQIDLRLWWPALIMENLVINAFFFMAGLVLLEKGEGTLEAQIVTPLRPAEYLASKVLSLALLSLLESLLMILIISGWDFNWLLLAIGILALVALYGLYGFVVVARYDSIGEFILPAALWTMGFSLPLLDYFGLWQSWLMYLHPIQAPLVLLRSAFEALSPWQIGYGLGYSLVWIGIAFWFSQQTFHRFVVTKQGVRRV